MAGVQKVTLNALNITIKNALIAGIIIAKNSPRTVGSKKKNGESRGVMSFSLRDSVVDTINVDVWGSEYYVLTFYERFLVGDIVEITSPKICVKSGDSEMYRPQVSSPFYLSLNEGMSDVNIHGVETFSQYLPLLHVPTKTLAGYYGLAEVLKIPEQSGNVHVDLLVVVKEVKPTKSIKTKAGVDMSVRCVEIIDNTTPATVNLDIFDIDTIQRAEEWRPLESVLFIADARVSWRGRGVSVVPGARCVLTHQPHAAEAEALRVHVRHHYTTLGGEAGAWRLWGGERAAAGSVAQVRERARQLAPFCVALHALVTHLDLDMENNAEDVRIRLVDHTGELTARVPITVLEEALGQSIKDMSAEDRATVRWSILLEHCAVKIAASPPRLLVLTLRRATQSDPIPLY